MTPEEAYEEALRRIREAETTGALELSLRGLELNRLPLELAGLTSLQSLSLSFCTQLSGDLSPLERLTSLQTLELSHCGELHGNLSPLASITSLQSLNLANCQQLSGDLSPLTRLTSLPMLTSAGAISSATFPTGQHHSLQTLDLSVCKQLSGDLDCGAPRQPRPTAYGYVLGSA